ncbi:MAG: hypothetical protein COU32_01355 [Candidatus Magasanikbacteria bacterium CG10_big_fil_rev_8_21_14_0_10_42_10]|uniref:Nudix hydrolase domain-containing protein n=2 Tax=Candidatus Magasanikiibacteriota TaxID=1752731 RepID=A0A2H0TWP9_9BACT|nr:MAG: hypothetical protein COU32_01355 [Candidatus Magasanikbacteria bacterium CG10_big_fil_rev_8_21_14_0_10_42_10]PIZ94672.1 MAG: hypothetical protein COX82_00225 [Candidatus Magasanikbacteria bacterium CG_4_10_14_0_2_um_filter_41_10]
MKRRKLLLATGNKGKVKEIKQFLHSLPYFQLVSLEDLQNPPEEPEETGTTIEENALLKANYYAKETGLLSLADDSAFVIDALDGWPGVTAARVHEDRDERCHIVLEKMKGKQDRHGQLQTTLALVDPEDHTSFLSFGALDLEVLDAMPQERKYGLDYDPILFIPEKGKTLDEIKTAEKNGISSRGKALSHMKYYLQNQYGGKHFVVPVAMIIRDGKILMNKRNDPHNPQFHEVWEFPGGTVEIGENIFENVVRECKEETGYDVEILEQLPFIRVKTRHIERFSYQIYLVPVLCKVVGGEGVFSDDEVLEMKWYTPEEIPSLKLFPDDGNMVTEYLELIQEGIKRNDL